ncbi:histidine-rich glycoprotein [Drosophila serrata]|uniref:histidine-rich glycoprotein n=1 Tax=Drosophila serrata TaxID=7274 RepID=UPI000A1D1459|nr:histidine-rich glycoprotein [Drosophila serrata]
MKFFVCILALVAVAQAGLLPHVDHHHGYHHADLPHLVDAEIHHSDGIHLGHSAAIVHHDDHHLDHHFDHHLESLPTTVYHHEELPHHYHYARYHTAPVVHHHHHDTHAAIVHHKTVVPAHLDVHSHSNLLSFAKHALHGKYGKVRITETHY